jgi:PadR family transcriptional regulator, regulatory protein PadR
MGIRIRASRQTLSVIAELLDQPSVWRYGYDLSRQTGLKSGTLYPILMRLEQGKWLETRWQESPEPGRPPRHMYRLSAEGRRWARQELASASSVALQPATAKGN